MKSFGAWEKLRRAGRLATPNLLVFCNSAAYVHHLWPIDFVNGCFEALSCKNQSGLADVTNPSSSEILGLLGHRRTVTLDEHLHLQRIAFPRVLASRAQSLSLRMLLSSRARKHYRSAAGFARKRCPGALSVLLCIPKGCPGQVPIGSAGGRRV